MIPAGTAGKWYSFILRPAAQRVVLSVIIINSIILGMETSPAFMDVFGPLLRGLDKICLAIFTVEIVLKVMALRLAFFRSSWNVFDFVIVAIAFLPSGGPLAVLRALRVFRVFQLFTNLPRLRRLVLSFLGSLPSIAWLMGLLAIFFYVFAVLTTTLYGLAFPEFFGDIGESMYTLFQILTLESWSMGIVRPVMEQFPHAYLIFVPFIIFTAFVVLNAFIGVLVNSLQEVAVNEEHPAGETRPASAADVQALQAQIVALEVLVRENAQRRTGE